MKKADTQNKTVLKHLRSGKKISTFQAFSKYGITRLAARIFDLKELGHNIKSVRVNKKDVSYNDYYLIK